MIRWAVGVAGAVAALAPVFPGVYVYHWLGEVSVLLVLAVVPLAFAVSLLGVVLLYEAVEGDPGELRSLARRQLRRGVDHVGGR